MKRQFLAGMLVVGTGFVAIAQDTKVPEQFQGEWAGSLERCGVPHEGRLVIREEYIEFYASHGPVLSILMRGLLEVEIEREATGEGQTRRDVRRFALSEDGRTLTDVTNTRYQLSRVRCDR